MPGITRTHGLTLTGTLPAIMVVMTNKTLHTAALSLVDDMAHWRVLQVACLGYTGALPDGVDESDAVDFRATVQTIAKLIEAKAYVHAPLA